MTRKLLTGNSAAAWGARLARVDYIPAFPITPQTEIIEDLAAWIDRGEMDARLVTLESERPGYAHLQQPRARDYSTAWKWFIP
jgi:pyruvate ferredoxin oxidoreductase alpha subunit